LVSTQEHNLDGLVRSFGMTVLSRLESADDVLKTIVTANSDVAAEARVATLPWVRSVRRVASAPRAAAADDRLVIPTPAQQRALSAHQGVLLWDTDAAGNARVLLVHALAGGAWLYTEVEPSWLWASSTEFAGGATLLVLDDSGRALTTEGEVPAALRPASSLAQLARPGGAAARAAAPWMARSWE